VINVSSVAGRWGIPGENVYVAAKHGLDGLADVARAELRGSGVSLTTVYMGPVAGTELSLGMKPSRRVRFSTSTQVAAAIVGASLNPTPEVWVPRSLRWRVKSINVLPRSIRDRLLAAAGVMEIATHVDRAARAAYEHRIASSGSPGRAPEPAGMTGES